MNADVQMTLFLPVSWRKDRLVSRGNFIEPYRLTIREDWLMEDLEKEKINRSDLFLPLLLTLCSLTRKGFSVQWLSAQNMPCERVEAQHFDTEDIKEEGKERELMSTHMFSKYVSCSWVDKFVRERERESHSKESKKLTTEKKQVKWNQPGRRELSLFKGSTSYALDDDEF